MVIQRIQTVFLLLAVIFMVVFVCVPMASIKTAVATTTVHPYDVAVLLIVNVLIAVLLFLGIFMFKNLKRQMTMTLVSMVLIACSATCSAFFLFTGHEGGTEIELGGSLLLLLGALVSALLAYRGMKKDYKLLQSYNRLR